MGTWFQPTAEWIDDVVAVGRIVDSVVEQTERRLGRDRSSTNVMCEVGWTFDDDARDHDGCAIEGILEADGFELVELNPSTRVWFIEVLVERGELGCSPRMLLARRSDSMREIVAALADAGLFDRVSLAFDGAGVMQAVPDLTINP
jgi:hypothetical protein